MILSDVFYVGIFYFGLYKVLMDTGALHSSYISRDLVDKHRDAWRGKVMYVDGKDCLGDNKTKVSVTENVKIDVLLRAPDGVEGNSHSELLCVGHAWYGYDARNASHFGLLPGGIGDRAGDSVVR